MEIKIQSVHFDATEKLQAFITKKTEKLEKSYEDTQKIKVQLKIGEPATILDETTSLSAVVPGNTLSVEKTCDTSEEGIDQCLDAMKVRLTKFKERQRKR